MSPQGRALVLDDHTFMRGAVSRCLAQVGLAEVTSVETLAAARQDVATNGAPTVAVIDLRLSDGSALELLPDLTAAGTKVVIFTSSDDQYSVRSAYAAGAAGYVLKSAEPQVLIEALEAVLSGRVHIEPSVATLLVAGVQMAPKGGAKQLSAREIDVLKLAAEGMSNNEIASTLSVSPLAVKGHFVRIGRKLGANDRTHMVAEAMRADLLR